MVKYRQGIAIIDTADPILFRFLPPGDTGDVVVPPKRAVAESCTLAQAVEAMDQVKETNKPQSEPEPLTAAPSGVTPRPEGNKQSASKPKKKRIAFSDLRSNGAGKG